jgi:cytochrome c oxidase subunit III
MTIAVILFGLFMASLVTWVVRQSFREHPWVAVANVPELPAEDVRTRQNLRLALLVMIAVIASLFGLFMSAYLMRMEYADWRPVAPPSLLWLNTGVLVLCSVALQWAYFAVRGGRMLEARVAFVAGGALSLAFIVGQYLVWQQLNARGYYLDANAASAFFFVLTGLHVLHLAGGLIAWGRTGMRLLSGGDPVRLRLGIELCAVYWHFLLAVWVVLFALLSSS